MKEQALAYLDKGWSVFPVHSPLMGNELVEENWIGKKPLIDWKIYQDRKPNKEEVSEWWTKWPQANLAVITGKLSGVIVLDFDDTDELPEWQTLISHTGGGYHFWFKHPGIPIWNRKKIKIDNWICDIRGDGGFVCTPPDIHRSGAEYIWMNEDPVVEMDRGFLRKVLAAVNERKKIDKNYASIIANGVGEGERNDSLTRLTGRFFKAGLSYEEVLAMDKKVNEGFKPPLSDVEVVSIVDSISQAEHRKKLTDLKDPTGYLSVLLEQVIPSKGWLRDWVDYCDKIMETPKDFLFFCGLTGLAATVGKRVWMPDDDEAKIFPNLWVCALGPSSISAKSTAINKIRRAVNQASGGNVIMPDSSSLEQFWNVLERKDVSAFMVQDEFGTFLTQAKREYNSGMIELLTKLYDYHDILERDTIKHGIKKLEEPCLSLLAASTLQWFTENLKENDIRGGFIARMGFAFSSRSTKRIPHRDEVQKSGFADLVVRLNKFATMPPRILRQTPEARARYSEWYFERDSEYAGQDIMGHFWGRYRTVAKKAAMIYSLDFDLETVMITAEGMEYGLRLADYHLACAEYLLRNEFVFNIHLVEVSKVEKFLQEKKQGTTTKDILTSLHIDFDYFNRKIVPNLLKMGRVVRKGDYFKWIGDLENEDQEAKPQLDTRKIYK